PGQQRGCLRPIPPAEQQERSTDHCRLGNNAIAGLGDNQVRAGDRVEERQTYAIVADPSADVWPRRRTKENHFLRVCPWHQTPRRWRRLEERECDDARIGGQSEPFVQLASAVLSAQRDNLWHSNRAEAAHFHTGRET